MTRQDLSALWWAAALVFGGLAASSGVSGSVPCERERQLALGGE